MSEEPPEPKKNNTDYNFPEYWGQMTSEQKCTWYFTDRARRQAFRQGMKFTSFEQE